MAGSTITMKMLTIPNTTTAQNLDTFASKRKTLRLCCISSSVTAAATACCSPSFQLQHAPPRRSGNYGPSLWDFDYIQSLITQYAEERYLRRASELKVEVKKMLVQEKELSTVEELLGLIDDLQRLGVSYHFEDEINQMLGCLYEQKYAGGKNNSEGKERDLYTTALAFRLLRQHGFSVPQDVFDCFRNEKGDFDQNLGNDTKGLLQLYEASFLSKRGEKTLDLAREFATNFLQKYPYEKIDENLSLLVRHALELPIHWRVERPNARWFVEAYEKRPDVNPLVLELAKLDFNIVQATHQQELKHVYEWWKQTGLLQWEDLCRTYLQEAEWYFTGYTPTLEEYMNNAWISISAPLTLSHTYFVVANPIENEVAGSLHKYQDVVRYSGTILRLADDLGTSQGGSREEAEEYVRYLIDETWKKMNEGVAVAADDSAFLQDFVRIAADIGRTAQYFYQHGDGHGIQTPQIKQNIPTLLFQSIF
ncbi:UNVERIFIED_CONTAM: (-)-alpha-terpineol synthase [Sesamum calycinum]|uniref:(-)-alpha-terpineol synthase n=1 Tax=Sesamum calycinum TaxID=2727403 RepID=A0AAW2PME2_9LAMI